MMANALCLLFVAILALPSCASQPPGVAVAPGKLFPGGFVNIKAPTSDGWRLIQSSGSGMVFGREGQSKGDSFVAALSMFNLPPTKTPDEFESLIKTAAAKDIDPGRFDIQQQSSKYSDERRYPCVRYQAVAKDKRPQGSKGPLLLELDGLYCRHPVRRETGFAAVYSYRGEHRHTGLRSEAESFIQGIQVPDK